MVSHGLGVKIDTGGVGFVKHHTRDDGGEIAMIGVPGKHMRLNAACGLIKRVTRRSLRVFSPEAGFIPKLYAFQKYRT